MISEEIYCPFTFRSLAILAKTVDGIRILQEVHSKLAEVSCPKNSWKIQWPAAFTSRIVLTLLNCRGRCLGFSHFSSRMWPDIQIIPEFLLTIYDQNSGHRNNWLQLLCVQYWDIFFFFWKLYIPIISWLFYGPFSYSTYGNSILDNGFA